MTVAARAAAERKTFGAVVAGGDVSAVLQTAEQDLEVLNCRPATGSTSRR